MPAILTSTRARISAESWYLLISGTTEMAWYLETICVAHLCDWRAARLRTARQRASHPSICKDLFESRASTLLDRDLVRRIVGLVDHYWLQHYFFGCCLLA